MSPGVTADMQALAEGVRTGQRPAVAAALNLLDDQRAASRTQATALMTQLLPHYSVSTAQMIGITGPPGAGKSSLTAALISHWLEHKQRVGVIAVDPSSPVSGGALLGDRLRMTSEVDNQHVFIRSLSNRGQFGGLSQEVWPMSLVMLCCFDIVIVETVGVGQREVDIASSCDTTCFVAQPGSGDSIQFLKAGILEVPHVVVVNKEDMGAVATRTLAELSGVLSPNHPDGGWTVPVLATSATRRSGIAPLGDTLVAHHQHLLATQRLQVRRREHQARWLLRCIEDEYGKKGVLQLGGAPAFIKEFSAHSANPLEQYSACLQRLSITH
jgi:LAO/AO transport system kinase